MPDSLTFVELVFRVATSHQPPISDVAVLAPMIVGKFGKAHHREISDVVSLLGVAWDDFEEAYVKAEAIVSFVRRKPGGNSTTGGKKGNGEGRSAQQRPDGAGDGSR